MTEKLKGWKVEWVKPTALFIHDYLLENGEAYAFEIWKALRDYRRSLGIKVCTYDNFRRNYIYILKKLGLIRKVREEPGKRGFNRVYYEIVPGKEDAVEWVNPQKYFKLRKYGYWKK